VFICVYLWLIAVVVFVRRLTAFICG